jgi:hypothetical protein
MAAFNPSRTIEVDKISSQVLHIVKRGQHNWNSHTLINQCRQEIEGWESLNKTVKKRYMLRALNNYLSSSDIDNGTAQKAKKLRDHFNEVGVRFLFRVMSCYAVSVVVLLS